MVAMPGSSMLYTVYLLAFARLVVLLTRDFITEPPRDKLATALKERGHNRLAYFVLCPWCVSFWLAIPAAPIIYAYGHHWWLFVPALAMALSAVAGALARVKG
jgi:uncharacterized membrane protein YdjX (TVP38/TMEM64 family)